MKTIYGIEIWPSPLLTETREGRVRGGYMNRWLIRAMVTELIAEMERSLAKSCPQTWRPTL